MDTPVIQFDDPATREASLAAMIDKLRGDLASVPAGSVEARSITIMIDVMPAFVRSLDRERRLFVDEVKAARAMGRERTNTVDDHLMVLALPITNMLGSIILTMVPSSCYEADDVMTVRVRRKMFHHIIDNIINGVTHMLGTNEEPAEQKTDNVRLHS